MLLTFSAANQPANEYQHVISWFLLSVYNYTTILPNNYRKCNIYPIISSLVLKVQRGSLRLCKFGGGNPTCPWFVHESIWKHGPYTRHLQDKGLSATSPHPVCCPWQWHFMPRSGKWKLLLLSWGPALSQGHRKRLNWLSPSVQHNHKFKKDVWKSRRGLPIAGITYSSHTQQCLYKILWVCVRIDEPVDSVSPQTSNPSNEDLIPYLLGSVSRQCCPHASLLTPKWTLLWTLWREEITK